MDENTIILRAREFVRKSGIDKIPVDLNKYLASANAEIKVRFDLNDSEAGQSFFLKDRHIICVNGNHIEERQRFTVLHEIAHIVLKLPSIHKDKLNVEELGSYNRRPEEEIFCDVFAAECLLPYNFFKKDVSSHEFGFSSIEELKLKYNASLISTASRYAALSDEACAMVLSEKGVIRYVSRSLKMRELGFWVEYGIPVPQRSVIKRLITTGKSLDSSDIPAYVWTNKDSLSECSILEEACLLKNWEQGVSMLWLDEDIIQHKSDHEKADKEDALLDELDGVLPWPSKSKKR